MSDDGLEAILDSLSKDKKFTVPVMRMSSEKVLAKVPGYISSGFLALDALLGGGYPVRRIVEVYGENSSGKSMLATYAAIEADKQDALVVYADVEVALGIDRMEKLGFPFDRCLYAAPNSLEETFTLFERMVQEKTEKFGVDKVLFFVIDSVAALVTADELETDKSGNNYETRNYPTAARNISGAMRKLKNLVAANNVCLFLVNQTRQKLGVMFGDGVTTYGGEAIKFYSSVRVELQNTGKLSEGTGRNKDILGINTRFTTVKHRLTAPYQSIVLPIYYDDRALDGDELLFNLLKDNGYLGQAGSWYTLNLGTEEEPDEVKFMAKEFAEKVVLPRWDDLREFIEDMWGVELPHNYTRKEQE